MEAEDIRRLLEKYEAAETSLEEENVLKDYFESEMNVPDDWIPFKLLFGWKDKVHSSQLSDSFSDRLREKIEASEQSTPDSTSARILRFNPFIRWGIAASLMIAFGLWILMQERTNNSSEPNWTIEEETFDSPEDAYKQTMEALAFVSTKMNKGRIKATESIGKLKRLDDVIPN